MRRISAAADAVDVTRPTVGAVSAARAHRVGALGPAVVAGVIKRPAAAVSALELGLGGWEEGVLLLCPYERGCEAEDSHLQKRVAEDSQAKKSLRRPTAAVLAPPVVFLLNSSNTNL